MSGRRVKHLYGGVNKRPTRMRLSSLPAVDVEDMPEIGVDREGRAIRGYSVITRGEALGHGYWIDGEFLDSVVEAGNAAEGKIKARYTHPGLSSDGLGTLLGRAVNFRREGNQVLADLEFVDSAFETPDGDLASYVMQLAEETPELFGTSVVYTADYGAEDLHWSQNKNEKGRFVSPDEENAENLPHARLARLWASDIVDDPAANPNGMFARGLSDGNSLPAGAERLLNTVLGGDEEIEGIHPERVRTFLADWCRRHDIRVYSGDAVMFGDPALEPSDIESPEIIEQEVIEMSLENLTLEQLRSERALLVEQLESAAQKSALDAERVRALGITKSALQFGLPERAAELIEGGHELLAAESQLKSWKIQKLESGTPPAVGPDADPETPEPGEDGADKYASAFAKDKSLRDEFGTVEAYRAYATAIESGKVSISGR